VRDGSFSVHALLSLGYTEEASAFVRWLGDRLDGDEPVGAAPPLKIMYRVDGSSDLDEVTLPGFDGWRASRPVRVGNGASDQLQLDIYGEALDAIFLGDRNGIAPTHRGWAKIRRLVDWLADNWQRPEEGIWETRGGQKAFTYGRLMSWVAFDRAIRMARDHGKPARLDEWERARDAVYDEIMTRGWSDERQAFVQHDETSVLDAALLYMPLVGFIAGHDERWQSTLAAMEQELVSDSLVYRYDVDASPDGVPGEEATFSLCSFWWVEALTRAGRLDEARLAFEKMLTYANHVGLFSEEIGPTGEQLGNFPQAFTHLALISAGYNLDRQLG
jgi:GH15 family glucan-1,4-alpha-glucosidase